MQKLGTNEIRKRFLEFFESKGHYVGKSASLIPNNDKSLLSLFYYAVNHYVLKYKNFISSVLNT